MGRLGEGEKGPELAASGARAEGNRVVIARAKGPKQSQIATALRASR
jgi:hypothetical protein